METVLKIADRCDRCRAQAFVRVVMSSGLPLDFCGNHFRRYELALLAQAADIIDERWRINDKPSPSAAPV